MDSIGFLDFGNMDYSGRFTNNFESIFISSISNLKRNKNKTIE